MKKRIYRLLVALVLLQFLTLAMWTHWLYLVDESEYEDVEYEEVEDSDNEVMHV